MRVLHLIRTWSEPRGLFFTRQHADATDASVLACRDSICSSPDAEHRVCILGSSDDEARAASLGLRSTDRIGTPLGIAALASRSLRRFIATRPLFDEVRCWDTEIVPLARDAAPMSRVIDATPYISQAGPVGVANAKQARAARRAELGLDDDALLACLLADPPQRGDAVRMMFMAGTLYEAGFPLHIILPRGSDRLTRARRFHKASRLGGKVFVTPEPIWAWLPACDAAVLVREEDRVTPHERLMIRSAHAMGVPTICPRDESVAALHPAAAEVCVAPTNHVASLARSLVRVIESRPLRDGLRAPLSRAAWQVDSGATA